MNEPQSLHELHQEDAEEERKRIAKFNRMAGEASTSCSNLAWCAGYDIAEASEGAPFHDEEIVYLTWRLWQAVRKNMTEIPAPLWKRQIIESLEEVMLICQERIDQDLIDASDSLEARERT